MRNINTDIWNIINSLDPSLLKGKGIYFGGGTLISILHNEYRVSTDIDLFCSNHEAFLNIRNHLRKNSMESLFTKTLPISKSSSSVSISACGTAGGG